MTEEAQAPAPAAESSISEAPTTEAPIDSTPAADAAPEPKAEAPKEKPRSRMEALEKAFKTIEGDEKPEPKADDKAEASTDDRPRGPDGKFIARDAEAATDKPQDGQKAQAEGKPAEGEKTPLSEPPARFSADAKAAWKDVPESVRGEVRRAMTEMERGIQQYQQALDPLKPYMEQARRSGTTIDAALKSYVAMENTLRQNPAAGLRALAQNLGMTPADMASLLTGQAAEGDQTAQRENVRMQQYIGQLQQKIEQLEQSFTATRQQTIEESVTKFAREHPRFDELSTEIVRLLETGYAADLEEAYEKAERLNPAPQPAAPPQPAPTPQPRPARSVTGAPNAGSNPGSRTPSATRTEAISRAMRAAGLA